ncbi:RNA polymerase sigma factor [Sutcliffiella cohnii]
METNPSFQGKPASIIKENEGLQAQYNHEKTELINRARKGDQEAFNELVRIHRARAHGWAYSVTKDTFLAEDIVQEALFNAFLKLGTLLDTNKFLPWLRQIVHNQALMNLRKSQHFKEKPFTSLEQNHASIDWGSIDQVLNYLTCTSYQRISQETPDEHLMRLSVIEGIQCLLKCLSHREKKMFEAYFFDDLSPTEIAKIFDTSKANVYNTISRSKVKVQRERIRICIQNYVHNRSELGLTRRKILPKPQI